MKLRILMVAGAILALLAIILISCAQKAKTEVRTIDATVIPVKVVIAGTEAAADAVLASGFVSSETEARLAFKTGGVIQRIYVKEGQQVRKGQLLATLDLTEINSLVSQAQQGLDKAERDLKRVENLYRDTVASLEQYQNATTAVKIAKEQLNTAKFNQSYSEIHAANDGRIVKKLLNEGEIVGPGVPVFYMNASNSGGWLVKVGIADKDWARLKAGDKAKVHIDAYPEEEFTASISQLSQSPDPMSGLYQAELKLANTTKPMATGLFAKAEIVPSEVSTYVTIPVDAVIEGNGNEASIFTVIGDKAQRQPLKIAFIKGDKVMVHSGVTTGTQIITDGSAYLTDGATIKVVQ